ncbi:MULTISPECIES: hypothetical protein [Salinibaculum]|uniref:hypothetical protein n=1 Tax=Salinibaculum TaxID=2732368 RepID=UPI0030D3E46C
MTRKSGLFLGSVVLVAFGVAAVSFGFAEPYISASAVPVGPPIALGGAVALLFLAALLNTMFNALVWRRMGQNLGLTPEGGINVFAKHDLTGEVDGRPVRVHTYEQGGGGDTDSSRTYTLVEAELDSPVEWSALVGPPDRELSDLGRAGGATPDIAPDEESLADVPEFGETRTVTVQDGVAVWGDLSDERADALLTPRLERAVTDIEGGVGVGDATGTMIDAMSEMLEGAEGLGASLAQGMLDLADGDRGKTPEATVTHEQRGLLLDDSTLERRVEAVVAAADAAGQASSGM